MVQTKQDDINELLTPDLMHWEPTDDQYFYVFDGDSVIARYEELYGLKKGNRLSLFIINKKHYRDRMDNIIKHINYFLNYYDEDKELFKATMSMKFIIDQNPNLTPEAFIKEIIKSVITPSFIIKIKNMTNRLYQIDIDTDEDGKYKSTPKITNNQARLIVAVSFAIRMILPLCVHYSDTNNNFIGKKDYINCFDKLYMKIIHLFEKDDIEIFNAICRFVKYRVDRSYSADIGICNKKKQLYGIVKSTYLEEVIHEVILVKSLHKLDYNRSAVSFIDGVIFCYHYNFKIENFKHKPVEIEPNDASDDSDDHLSHAEAIEMSVYRIDESNALINEANASRVIKDIEKRFHLNITDEEINFYIKNIKISSVTQMFLNSFYAKFFHDPYAIYSLNQRASIKLLVYMKHYLQLRGMTIIPQLCTAKIKGKFKDNIIKNSKFTEKFLSSTVYQSIIQTKYKYMKELNQKEDPIIKKLSAFVNSTFEFVDTSSEINGIVYEDINVDLIIDEFLLFLSII